jgi:hypothetical protein
MINEFEYQELLPYTKQINKFTNMVQSEKLRPVAKRVLMYIANISECQSSQFIEQYFSNMDMRIIEPKVLFNDLNRK